MNDEDRFLGLLTEMVSTRERFLSSPAAVELLTIIRARLAPSALSLGRFWQFPYSGVDDAANMILVALFDHPDTCRYIVTNAAKPFSYTQKCIQDWVGSDTGHGWFEVKGTLQRPLMAWVEGGLDTLATRDSDPSDLIGVNEDHTLASAVSLTIAAVSPRTPGALTPYLPEVVHWMAENPPVNGREGSALADAGSVFLELTEPAISAVARISWGGRPNQSTTSLLGAFLRDPRFDPSASPTHFRALRLYQQRVRSSELVRSH